MKKIILTLYLNFVCLLSIAQTFEGRVLDSATKGPIAGAYVYMNGTSIHTSTDSNGIFKLTLEKFINTDLVISHVAYEPVVIENPGKGVPKEIYLQEAHIAINEVHVIADQFSRADRLKVFRAQFLGTSRGGQGCVIENEDDIVFEHDSKKMILRAYSKRPLTIYNNYLGYKIEFNLVDFQARYLIAGVPVVFQDIVEAYFLGTSSYIDMKPADNTVKRRRDDVYKSSSLFFMKQFANKELDKTSFKISDGQKRIKDIYEHFLITDEYSVKSVSLNFDTKANEYSSEVNSEVYGRIFVGSGTSLTEILFLTNKFLVDEYGNVDKINDIVYSGYMGEQRLGDMLPLDYTIRANF